MRSLILGLAALCLAVLGCGDAGDDQGVVTEEGLPGGDPSETLDDQLARIAADQAEHGQLPGKADGVLPGFEDALDVDKPMIIIAASVAVPTYQRADGANGFSLGGTEFWQKWTGGHNPTYSFEEGTDAGRLCMQASAIRFEAIMADPPAELVELNANSNWGGSFFNWNDDYSKADFGDASGARLWAWRTGLMKWISQTGKDGACHLPTKELVQRAAVACLSTARSSAGEIQGCSAR